MHRSYSPDGLTRRFDDLQRLLSMTVSARSDRTEITGAEMAASTLLTRVYKKLYLLACSTEPLQVAGNQVLRDVVGPCMQSLMLLSLYRVCTQVSFDHRLCTVLQTRDLDLHMTEVV